MSLLCRWQKGVSSYLRIFYPSGNSLHVLFKRRESNEGFKTESYRDRGFRKVTLVESGALFQAAWSSAPSPSKSWHTQSAERHKHCLVSCLRGEKQGSNDCRAHSHQSPGICSGGKNISGFGSLKATCDDETVILGLRVWVHYHLHFHQQSNTHYSSTVAIMGGVAAQWVTLSPESSRVPGSPLKWYSNQ